MYDNGIWEGGYVLNLNGNGDIHYVNRNGMQNSSGSGEGCGSSSGGGSGSGCGSGSGGLVGYGNLTAGSANVSGELELLMDMILILLFPVKIHSVKMLQQAGVNRFLYQ